MKLNDELIKLKGYMDSNDESKAEKQIDFIRANFTSEKDKKAIENFISSGLKELTKYTDGVINDLEVKIQLLEVAEIVSLSYIAKNYFQKTRQWLYQKLNGNIVNGKPAKFTSDEINTLNHALKDISKKIGSIAIS